MRAVRLLIPVALCGAMALTACGSTAASKSGAAPVPSKTATTAAGNGAAAPAPPRSQPSLFEYSTINALIVGLYDGTMTIGQLKRLGNYGVGTINGLNGEVVEMNGTFYQIAYSGHVHILPDSTKTPWMIVTHFAPQTTVTARNIPNYAALNTFLAKYRPNRNVFYAIKITGTFSYVKARSVAKQHRPFPPLTAVTAHQAIFRFHNVKGTLFGFWTPNYLAGINVPGYHLHFLNQSRSAGGHVLQVAIANATVRIEQIDRFHVELPNSGSFASANLATQTQAIKQAESNHPS